MKRRNRLGIVLTLALLAFGLTTVVAAQEAESDEEITLIGQLSENAEGQFVLTDPESGDQVWLKGSAEKLAEHVGTAVAVTGVWAEDDEGNAYFVVSAVESAEA